MGLWLSFSLLLVVLLMLLCHMFRQKRKKYENMIKSHQALFRAKHSEVQEKDSKLQEKDSENLHLKEELLKIRSSKEKMKEHLEQYQKENKRLQEAAKKKRKKRSDAGKHRDVSSTSTNKRTGKPKGANGGGLKNPDPKEIDYTREHHLETCPECNLSFKNVNPFDHHDHFVRDFEKVKRGLRLVYIRHVIYRYKCPGCGKIVFRSFGKLKNARYGLGMIAFVLWERIKRGGSWEGIRSTMEHVVHEKECIPTIKAFIDWIRKYEDEMREIHDAFVEAIKTSPFAHVDETGLPMDGENWWLWVIVAAEVVLYISSKSRGSDTIKDIFDEYEGILLSDFWSAYNKLDVEQQKCLQHVVKELRKISLKEQDKRDKAEKELKIDDDLKSQEKNGAVDEPKSRGRPPKQPTPLTSEKREKLEKIKVQSEKASKQTMKFIDFFRNAWKKDGNDMSVNTPLEKRISITEAELRLKARIQEIKDEGPANADIERLITRFEKYGPCLFTYLENPDIQPDNNAAEREIRPFVIQRKISRNFISPEVMRIYTMHLSLYRTCRRNQVNYESIIIPLLKGDTAEVLRLLGLLKGKPPPNTISR